MRAQFLPTASTTARAAQAVPVRYLPVFVTWTFTTEEWTPWDVNATAVCQGCPVRTACTAYADTTRPAVGIWGGQRRPPHDPAPRPDEAVAVSVTAATIRA